MGFHWRLTRNLDISPGILEIQSFPGSQGGEDVFCTGVYTGTGTVLTPSLEDFNAGEQWRFLLDLYVVC
jgi:hypothetical protein